MIEPMNDGAVLRVDGAATVEDAEILLALLLAHPDALVDLRHCTHLHAAVLQTLAVLHPQLLGPDGQSPVARLLSYAGLSATSTTTPDTTATISDPSSTLPSTTTTPLE